MIGDISIIVTHFHDFDWTELLIQKLYRFTDVSKIKEIVIINQDRKLESEKRLSKLSSKIRIIQYPKSEKHFQIQGHDHAYVLNRAINEVTGKYICIFDSDAHPIKPNWIDKCEDIFNNYDAILALDPSKLLETHPCFMFIKNNIDKLPISFDEGLFEFNKDTGRLVGQQLEKKGWKTYLIQPSKAFNGYFGYIYIDVIYHHSNASYYGAADNRITRQVTWKNKYFKKLVMKNNLYSFTFVELLKYKFTSKIHTLINVSHK